MPKRSACETDLETAVEAPDDDDEGPLGQRVEAPDVYSPSTLFPIPRERGRALLKEPVPFVGEDIWNCYELSWLNDRGVPRRGQLTLRVPCASPNLVESKSLKLYLNSLSFKSFADEAALLKTIVADVSHVVGMDVEATLDDEHSAVLDVREWTCVDDEDVGDLPESTWLDPDLPQHTLKLVEDETMHVSEKLVSHLLRTLCPVTGQPDWGSLLIEYTGQRIDRGGLLKYITSLRREVGFHENAVERVACDLAHICRPSTLRVTGRFLRRGGIDINPVRVHASSSAGTHQLTATGLPQVRVPGQ